MKRMKTVDGLKNGDIIAVETYKIIRKRRRSIEIRSENHPNLFPLTITNGDINKYYDKGLTLIKLGPKSLKSLIKT